MILGSRTAWSRGARRHAGCCSGHSIKSLSFPKKIDARRDGLFLGWNIGDADWTECPHSVPLPAPSTTMRYEPLRATWSIDITICLLRPDWHVKGPRFMAWKNHTLLQSHLSRCTNAVGSSINLREM